VGTLAFLNVEHVFATAVAHARLAFEYAPSHDDATLRRSVEQLFGAPARVRVMRTDCTRPYVELVYAIVRERFAARGEDYAVLADAVDLAAGYLLECIEEQRANVPTRSSLPPR
jgi:hypothetical protein